MDGLFDFLNIGFLHDLLPNSWFEDAHQHFGSGLTDEMIVQSVQEASDFFNMNAPINIHEDWTTGVMTGMSFTENDDILVFNRQQMLDMGITDREGFDLVMTHEGAHRKLQGMDTGFNSHQEELCCDYMAGVRAGLNGMDEGKMETSLGDTTESATHPDGAVRVAAIEAGVAFAHKYMAEHDGLPPTFTDCLQNFEETNVYTSTLSQEPGHINLRPDVAFSDTESSHPQLQREIKGFTQADVDWYEHQARISSGSEQQHWLDEARWARNHIHSFAANESAPTEDMQQMEIKGFTQADVDWYEHQARISSGSEQAHWLKEAQWARNHIHGFADAGEAPEAPTQEVHEFNHGGQYGNATGDYWDDSHSNRDELHGFVNDKSYHLDRAETAQHNAEWHEKRAEAAIARGDLSAAKEHTSKAESFRKWEQDHIKSAQRSTK
mgnify:CR=1 FL=1